MIDKAMEEELEEGEIPSPPRQKSPAYYEVISEEEDLKQIKVKRKRTRPNARSRRSRYPYRREKSVLERRSDDFDMVRKRYLKRLLEQQNTQQEKKLASSDERNAGSLTASKIRPSIEELAVPKSSLPTGPNSSEWHNNNNNLNPNTPPVINLFSPPRPARRASTASHASSKSVVFLDSDEDLDLEMLRASALKSQKSSPKKTVTEEPENELLLRAEALKTAIIKKSKTIKEKRNNKLSLVNSIENKKNVEANRGSPEKETGLTIDKSVDLDTKTGKENQEGEANESFDEVALRQQLLAHLSAKLSNTLRSESTASSPQIHPQTAPLELLLLHPDGSLSPIQSSISESASTTLSSIQPQASTTSVPTPKVCITLVPMHKLLKNSVPAPKPSLTLVPMHKLLQNPVPVPQTSPTLAPIHNLYQNPVPVPQLSPTAVPVPRFSPSTVPQPLPFHSFVPHQFPGPPLVSQTVQAQTSLMAAPPRKPLLNSNNIVIHPTTTVPQRSKPIVPAKKNATNKPPFKPSPALASTPLPPSTSSQLSSDPKQVNKPSKQTPIKTKKPSPQPNNESSTQSLNKVASRPATQVPKTQNVPVKPPVSTKRPPAATSGQPPAKARKFRNPYNSGPSKLSHVPIKNSAVVDNRPLNNSGPRLHTGKTSTKSIPASKRIVVNLGPDSSDDDDMSPRKLMGNKKPVLDNVVDSFLLSARRKAEAGGGVAVPSTPEAVHQHLTPSQRLEYLTLKQKLAEKVNDLKMKKLDAAENSPSTSDGKSNSPVFVEKRVATLDSTSDISPASIKVVIPNLSDPIQRQDPGERTAVTVTTSTDDKINTSRSITSLEADGAVPSAVTNLIISVPGNSKTAEPTPTPTTSSNPLQTALNKLNALSQEKTEATSILTVRDNARISRIVQLVAMQRKELLLESKAREDLMKLKLQMSCLEHKIKTHSTKAQAIKLKISKLMVPVKRPTKNSEKSGEPVKSDSCENRGNGETHVGIGVINQSTENILPKCSQDLPTSPGKQLESVSELRLVSSNTGTAENFSVPNAFVSYQSPLLGTIASGLNPMKDMCMHDLQGSCRDPDCAGQHVRSQV